MLAHLVLSLLVPAANTEKLHMASRMGLEKSPQFHGKKDLRGDLQHLLLSDARALFGL